MPSNVGETLVSAITDTAEALGKWRKRGGKGMLITDAFFLFLSSLSLSPLRILSHKRSDALSVIL